MKTNIQKINLIQVYQPTTDKDETEIEHFYIQLDIVLKSTKKDDMTIVVWDFNAEVGKGKVDRRVGEFGLDERNERGDI